MARLKSVVAALFLGAAGAAVVLSGCESDGVAPASAGSAGTAGSPSGEAGEHSVAQAGTAGRSSDAGAGGASGSSDTPVNEQGGEAGSTGSSDSCGGAMACSLSSLCPVPATVCQHAACTFGCCSTSNAAVGTACKDHGGSLCDGAGSCIGCFEASNCPAQQSACKLNTCDPTAHSCGSSNAPLGTACTDSGGVVCDGAGSCVAQHCADGVRDADESDVDCGGSCGATCADAAPRKCLVNGDCASGVCSGTPLVCQPPRCDDNVKNGNETDRDCGGAGFKGAAACPKCADKFRCLANTDCLNGDCFGGTGVATCVSCSDGAKDGNETGPDCGGTDCDALNKLCAQGTPCAQPSDCAPTTGNECVVATCVNNVCATNALGQTHTVSTGQTPGDCQKRVCDGAGGITTIDDTSDKPAASDACHVPACTGNPSAPDNSAPAAIGTNCANGDPFNPLHVCNATGSCVECNSNPDCNLTFQLDAGITSCVNHQCQ